MMNKSTFTKLLAITFFLQSFSMNPVSPTARDSDSFKNDTSISNSDQKIKAFTQYLSDFLCKDSYASQRQQFGNYIRRIVDDQNIQVGSATFLTLLVAYTVYNFLNDNPDLMKKLGKKIYLMKERSVSESEEDSQ